MEITSEIYYKTSEVRNNLICILAEKVVDCVHLSIGDRDRLEFVRI